MFFVMSLEKIFSMAPRVSKSPVIYIASKIPKLEEFIKKTMPEETVVSTLSQCDNLFCRTIESANEEKQLSDVEVLLCDGVVLQKNFKNLTNLKWAHCTWAGVENVVPHIYLSQRALPFTLTRHAGDKFASLMGEYVFAQIINFERNLIEICRLSKQGIWAPPQAQENVRTISELNVGILGVGVMGIGIAKFLNAGDAEVNGFAQTAKCCGDSKYKDFALISTNIADILPQCDYLINCLPSTPSTCGLLDDKLKICSKKPVFINVGRSSIIKEESLLLAIRNKWIAGAILDVFDEEPLPQSSSMWSVSEIIITPHIAAPSRAKDIAIGFKRNYEKYTQGECLNNIVNLRQGY